METKEASISRAEKAIASAQLRADWLRRISADLPDSISFPTVSNESESAHKVDTTLSAPGAWLSFSRPYGDAAWTASGVVAALEAAGFVAMPCTLASYGDWRSTVYPWSLEDMPETDRRGLKLRECDAVAPVWLKLNQHTGAEFGLFMRAPSGLVYRVNLDAPQAYRVTATRRDRGFGREWYFERSSVRVIAPDDAYLIRNGDESIAERSHLSRAYYEGPQHISGRLFWNLYGEELGIPASDMIAQLEGAKS